jgi:hypothetical protein
MSKKGRISLALLIATLVFLVIVTSSERARRNSHEHGGQEGEFGQ